MVGFLHKAVGVELSMIVNLAVQVDVLPPTSVALRVTILRPRVVQLNWLGVSERVNPQLSVLTLSTVAGGTVTLPVEPRPIVAFLHLATGGVTSFKVTVKLQLAVLPPSSAVRVTTTEALCPERMVLGGGDCVTMMEAVGVQLSLTNVELQKPTVPEQVLPAGRV